MDLFSSPSISTPAPPPPPTREEIVTEDLTRRVAENTAVRDQLFERRTSILTRGRQSMINSGLGIPS